MIKKNRQGKIQTRRSLKMSEEEIIRALRASAVSRRRDVIKTILSAQSQGRVRCGIILIPRDSVRTVRRRLPRRKTFLMRR